MCGTNCNCSGKCKECKCCSKSKPLINVDTQQEKIPMKNKDLLINKNTKTLKE